MKNEEFLYDSFYSSRTIKNAISTSKQMVQIIERKKEKIPPSFRKSAAHFVEKNKLHQYLLTVSTVKKKLTHMITSEFHSLETLMKK